MGAADAQFDLGPNDWSHYTIAIGESYPLEISAYGVGDYGAHPEILVEVRGGPYYGSRYQTLEANHSSSDSRRSNRRRCSRLGHPYEDVRLSLITSPYQNVTGSTSGLGKFDKDFCISDVVNSNVDLSSVTAEPSVSVEHKEVAIN